MAVIRPFRGLRPPALLAERVASPPYDVLSSEEARIMAEDNPYSFLHVAKPEIDLPPDIDPYDLQVYEQGRDSLNRMINDGELIQDPVPCLYIYRQQMGDHVQTGLVACAAVADYDRDVIKKHEFTRPDKEDDRTRHVDILDAHAEPVFLTYPAQIELDRLVAEGSAGSPAYDFVTPDGIAHTLWVADDPAWVARVQALFAAMPCLYVADGHHRSAAASRVAALRRQANPGHTGEEEYNFFLAVIFPDNQMLIMDYNRVVRDLHGRDEAAFLAAVAERFEVAPGSASRPDRRHAFGMYLGGKWYRLTARPGTWPAGDPVLGLDVSILQNNLLHPLLGIADPRKDKRIDFVGGIRGLGELERLVDGGGFRVAFALHPTSIEELMAIADTGQVMPPKSTWFEPKLRSGLFVHLLR